MAIQEWAGDAVADLDMLADSLMPSGADFVAHMFIASGARAPLIVWSPGPGDFESPLIERFAAQCRRLAEPDGTVPRAGLDLAAFEGLADWMMLLDALPDGRSFRYAHYGRGIADHFGRDMTGLTTADFGGHISQFFAALYVAARRRRQWVLSEHEPPRQVFVRSWRRLIVPLTSGDGAVCGFLAINVPDNQLRAGLEMIPDPVFIVDEGGIVRFANGAARDLFRADPLRGPGRTLRDLTGIVLEAELPPLDMAARRVVHDRVYVSLGGAVADEFLVTVNATTHRGRAFYVVMVRLMVA